MHSLTFSVMIIAKYGFPIEQSSIVKSVLVDDWTAEWAIIASNVLS